MKTDGFSTCPGTVIGGRAKGLSECIDQGATGSNKDVFEYIA
jgi:hypothetical protein